MSITLCMIVKNEENRLPGFLETYAECFDEIIIADTGSTDRTRIIAETFGAIPEQKSSVPVLEQPRVKLYEYQWNGNFAEARNFTLEKATSEWVIWLDPDDTFDKENFYSSKLLLKEIKTDALRIPVYSVSSPDEVLTEHPAPLYQIRILRNSANLRFKGFLHEYIDISAEQKADLEFPILHYGYADKSEVEKKESRNYGVIMKHLKECPEDTYALFLYGEYLKRHKLWNEENTRIFTRFFELKKEKDFTYYKMKLALSRNLFYLGDIRKSMENIFEVIDLFPNYAEAYLWLGGYFKQIKQLDYAEEYFMSVLNLEGEKFNNRLAYPIEYRYIPLINLGKIELLKGCNDKAIYYFTKALSYKKEPKLSDIVRNNSI